MFPFPMFQPALFDMTKEPTTKELIADTLFLMSIHDKTEVVDSHLVWTGPVDNYDAPVVRRGGRRLLSVRRVILELNGHNMDGMLATSSCKCPLCISHLQPMTRSALQKRTAKTTNWARSPARCAALSAKRRKTATLTIGLVREMREEASNGMTTRQAGIKYGVSQGTAADAIAFRTWKDYSNPFVGLMG